MIDISHKSDTLREAVAKGRVKAKKQTIQIIKEGKVPKGDVLSVAKVAGITAAKRTSEFIPFCHPVPLDWVGVEFELKDSEIIIKSTVRAIWKTGVEMDVLVATSVAALTVYDMLKPIDDTLEILSLKLLEKRGGKSQFTEKLSRNLKAAVLVISDSTHKGTREDRSGKIIIEKLKEQPVKVVKYKILPDDSNMIVEELKKFCDVEKLDLVITTGGTGLGPNDVTVEATKSVLYRKAPGIAEAMRAFGQKRTPYSMLSRSIAGVRKDTIIVNLPGSSKGVSESMDALFPGLLHAFKMIWGGGHA